jgi:hypothetical protein
MRDDTEDALLLAVNEIKKLRSECVVTLSSGNCSSFEHYKAVAGRVKGYDDSLEIIGKCLKTIQMRD